MSIIYCVYGLITYLAVIIVNAIFKDDLYKAGLVFIQSYQDNTDISWLNNIFSFLGGVFIIIWAAAYAFIARNKLQMLNNVSFLLFSVGLSSLLKLSFGESRPFWSDPNIKIEEYSCPAQTGNPSGHSYMAPIFFYMVLDAAFNGLEAVKLMFSLLMTMLVAQSRMGLGAHSANQVIFGIILGLSSLLMYHCYLKQYLHVLILRAYRYTHSSKGYFPRKLAQLALTLLCILITLLARYFWAPDVPFQSLALYNIICKPSRIKTVGDVKDGDAVGCVMLTAAIGLAGALSEVQWSDLQFREIVLGSREGIILHIKRMVVMALAVLIAAVPMVAVFLGLKHGIALFVVLSVLAWPTPQVAVFLFYKLYNRFLRQEQPPAAVEQQNNCEQIK